MRKSASDCARSSERTPTKEGHTGDGGKSIHGKGAESKVDSPMKIIVQGRGKGPLTKPRTKLFKRTAKLQTKRGLVLRTIPLIVAAHTLQRATSTIASAQETNPMSPKRACLLVLLSTGEADEEDRAPIVAEVSTRPTPPFVHAPIREPVGVTIMQVVDICISSIPVEEIAARSTEVGGATTSTFSGGCDTQEDTPAMSSCPSATSFGAVFHQDVDVAW